MRITLYIIHFVESLIIVPPPQKKREWCLIMDEKFTTDVALNITIALGQLFV